ncbi:amidohydrolase (plasmid) [Rhodococcus qingshengii]|uniref:amidohydrolase n=1 Tax=Rhodococcus qingshengii TaxID=334542 RepID=UPI0007E57664|nr:amidohydrolase [Rhodococcus qingshengii]BCF86270.1 amidohydrolase [Rhodococcus qingshengii]
MTTTDADLIIAAGMIRTLDPDNPYAQVVAVRDGRIIGLGDRSSIREWRTTRTEVIDLGPATVTPGLVDGHIHPVMGLDLTMGVDLSAVTDLDELTTALREEAGALDDREWIRGWGLDPNVFGAQPVTNEVLVHAVGRDRPVLLEMFDAHSSLASPSALTRAGVTGPRRFDQNSEVVCDDKGNPTGHLLEAAAMNLVRAILPGETPRTRRTRLLETLQGMAAAGITAGNAMDFVGDSHSLMTSLEADHDLPIRLRFAPFCLPGVGQDGLDHIIELQRYGGRRWQVDGVKFMIDGTIDGGTAWLDEPDSRGESTTPYWPDPAEYRNALKYLTAEGVPTVTHAIGDAGIRYALDTLRQAKRRLGAAPHRIEHIETLPSELVPLFRRYGVVASMQPTHCTHYTRADHSDNWSTRLGDERASRGFRTRDIRDSGAILALGSDWPIASYDPRAIISAAQLRRPAGRQDIDPVCPEQALTATMALEGYTNQAAMASGRESVSGRLALGYCADITAFAIDPLSAPPDELAEAPITLTVTDGTVTHRHRELHR